MTLQQLRLIIEAVEKGSISAAAEKLNISQPNASLSIKKLEEELGYPLLRRAGNGIFPTEQGYRFLEHAQVLLDEDLAIRAIESEQHFPRLRIGVMNYSPAIDAFLKFCKEKQETPKADFKCINVSFEAGVRLLKERKLDIVSSIHIKNMLPLCENVCKENRLFMKKVAKFPCCVRVRKDHPLLKKGVLDGSQKSFHKLSSYPYADYAHLEHLLGIYNQNAPVPFGCSYRISVEERDTRLKVVSETDAYSLGVPLTEKQIRQYGLVSIPVGTELNLVALLRKGDETLPDLERYLELLAEAVPKF